jgi:hypothetical protein
MGLNNISIIFYLPLFKQTTIFLTPRTSKYPQFNQNGVKQKEKINLFLARERSKFKIEILEKKNDRIIITQRLNKS